MCTYCGVHVGIQLHAACWWLITLFVDVDVFLLLLLCIMLFLFFQCSTGERDCGDSFDCCTLVIVHHLPNTLEEARTELCRRIRKMVQVDENSHPAKHLCETSSPEFRIHVVTGSKVERGENKESFAFPPPLKKFRRCQFSVGNRHVFDHFS